MSYSDDRRKARRPVSAQHGLKRIAVFDRSRVGCPKVLEAWVTELEWSNNAIATQERVLSAAVLVHAASEESLYVEVH